MMIGVTSLGAATFFPAILYGILAERRFQSRISEQNAIGLAEENHKRMHHDAHEIRILDGARKGYISLASFKDDQYLPLLFMHQKGTSFAINRNNGTIALWGICTSLIHPHADSWFLSIGTMKGVKYAVDMHWIDVDGNEMTNIYGVNTSTGKKVDPSSMRKMARNHLAQS